MDRHHMTDPFADWQDKKNKDPGTGSTEEKAQEVLEIGSGEEKTGSAPGEKTGRKESGQGKSGRKKTDGKESGQVDSDRVKDAGHKKTWAPYIATLLIIIIFSGLIYSVLYYLTLKSSSIDMKKTLDNVAECYHEGEKQWEIYEADVDTEYKRLLAAIGENMNRDKVSSKKTLVDKYMDNKFFVNLLIVNKNGDIEASAYQTSLNFHKDKSPQLYHMIQLEKNGSPEAYVPIGRDGTTHSMPRFYPHPLKDGSVLVAEVECRVLNQISMHRSSWKAQMDLVSTGMGGIIMVQSVRSGDIIYGSRKADIFIKARKKELRDKVYRTMVKRAEKSEHVQIRYIKQENNQ